MGKIFKSKIIWGLVFLVIVASIYFVARPKPKPEYTTFKVIREDLTQTVSATGAVRGADEIDLNFKTSGTLDEITVDVGDEVKAGEVLARLSARQLKSAVLEARASWQSAQASLDKLIKGATPEELAVTEEQLKSAEVTLNIKQKEFEDLIKKLEADEKSARDKVADAKRDLTTARDNLVRTMESELFDTNKALSRVHEILINDDVKNVLGALNSTTKDNTEDSYTLGISLTNKAEDSVALAKSLQTDESVNNALTDTYNALSQVSQVLSDAYIMLVNTPTSSDYSQTKLDSDKSKVSSDQATISSSISLVQTAESTWEAKQTVLTTAENNLKTFLANKDSKINTAQGAVDNAKVALALAQAELNLKKAPPRQEDINKQKARVNQAYAAWQKALADLDEVTLKAPLDGIITRINYDLGERTQPGKPVMSILGKSGLEIEVDIPESDIAKITLNQEASITLDAFGDDKVFKGQVISIDPAETIIQDVVYYKVKVAFVNPVEEIKPGMTANVDIITAKKNNVLVVPARAVKQNSGRYVDLLINGQEVERPVKTGLRGDGGLIEIISGLKEGDEVITFKK